MKKSTIITISIIGVLVIVFLVGFFTYIGYSNEEIGLRNLITSKLQDNQSEYDNLWKKIKQVAAVTKKDRDSLMKIFVEHANARSGSGSGGAVMKWVQESVPNISSETFKNLQNTIVSSRDAWTMRQKELIDFKREHDNILDKFPGSFILSGRQKIEITVITSDKTEKVFESGKDNDVDLF